MDILIVTAALIRQDNKILIAQRKPDSHLGLLWEFPGGKLEDGESLEQCLAREIKEELALDISVGSIFEVIYHDYNIKNILLLCYESFIKGGQIKALDCHDYKWVTIEELAQYNFTEADQPIVAKLRREKGETS